MDTFTRLFENLKLDNHILGITEMVAVVSELIGADSDELTIQIIENDKSLGCTYRVCSNGINSKSET